jgi:hypothetical protein
VHQLPPISRPQRPGPAQRSSLHLLVGQVSLLAKCRSPSSSAPSSGRRHSSPPPTHAPPPAPASASCIAGAVSTEPLPPRSKPLALFAWAYQPKSASYRTVFFFRNKSASASASIKNTASRTQPFSVRRISSLQLQWSMHLRSEFIFGFQGWSDLYLETLTAI